MFKHNEKCTFRFQKCLGDFALQELRGTVEASIVCNDSF